MEHHGFGNEAHDDTVMSHWVGDVWIRRFIAAEERRRRQGRENYRAPFVQECAAT